MGTVELTTAVRKSAPHVITITNPLPTPVTMTTSTNNAEISMPTTFLVGAQSEVCTLCYCKCSVCSTLYPTCACKCRHYNICNINYVYHTQISPSCTLSIRLINYLRYNIGKVFHAVQ